MKRKSCLALLVVAAAAIPACSHVKSDSRQPNVERPRFVRPTEALGDRVWGIACLSVASAREQPEHKAEMGTQVLMGNVVHVLQGSRIWYQVETADGYRAWLEKGTLVRCTRTEADAWERAPLLIVT